MTRWRLDLAYDGTNFHGWAAQPGLRTVQGEIEDWLSRLTAGASEIELVVAGRTDAGVHAAAQVAHVDLPDDFDDRVPELAHALGRVLPPDIALRSLTRAPAGFDARFSAIWRHYRFQLWDADARPDPLLRNQVVSIADRLDPELMTRAGATLLGLRDFAPFCKHRDGATTIRDLSELRTTRADDPTSMLVVDVRSDAFCHSMVRSLVGALVAVGSGRRDLAWLAGAASGSVRANDVTVMPPHGLILAAVGYPPDDDLAARADEARAVRTLPGSPA